MPQAPVPHDEAERLRALHRLEILDTPSEEGFDLFTRLASNIARAPIACVTMVDSDRLWFKSVRGLDVAEVPRHQGFCAHAILEPDQPLVIPDAAADPRFAENALVLDGPGLRFYAGVPIRAPGGEALGTLCVMDHVPREVTPEALEQLKDLAQGVGSAVRLHDTMRVLRQMATTDNLTGLANRAAFEARLRRGDRQGLGLVMIDMDRFKAINDTFGHAGGDAALREMARRLERCTRAGDLVARLGGDEFAVLCAGPDGLRAAETVAARLPAVLAEPFLLDDRPVPLRASVGVAPVTENTERAVREADAAMYALKRARDTDGGVTSR